MREIKFRGKRENGDFIYGDLQNGGFNGHKKIKIGIVQTDCYAEEVEEKTVGEYTGLKDKNGVDIYEGDIIPMSFKKEKYSGISYGEDFSLDGVVEYDTSRACYIIKYKENKHNIVSSDFGWYVDKGIEVIGNIHEEE